MTGSVFVDTNVLVYTRDSADPDKQRKAETWMHEIWQRGIGRTSVQVLSEFYVSVTRKLSPGLPTADAWSDVRDLMTWEPQPVDRPCMELGYHLGYRFSLSWWDGLIVAAAQLQQCSLLVTEDLQDGITFDDLTVVNPFLRAFEEFGVE